MVDHGVRDPLRKEQKQRDDRESDLQAFRVELLFWNGLLAPLRSGSRTKPANAPYDVEVDERSREGEEHHRNANRVGVEATGGSVYTGRSSKSRETNGDANAADSDDGGACALEQRKNEAGPADHFP